MARKGIKCSRVRTKAHTRTVCRSARTGRIVKGGAGRKMVCPKRVDGQRVRRAKNGSCYIKTPQGGQRFVAKVQSRRRRSR